MAKKIDCPYLVGIPRGDEVVYCCELGGVCKVEYNDEECEENTKEER